MKPLHVVVAGGGVAALESVIALRDLAGERVRLTLVAPDDDFAYRPMSVAEPFALGPPRTVPLSQVARDFHAELVQDRVTSVSPTAKTVRVEAGGELAYDRLVVALGARRRSAFEHATTFRGQEDAEALHGLIQDLEGGYVRRIAFVVPAGTVWTLPIYELALMTARRAREMCIDDVELTIVTPEEKPLAIFGDEASAEVGQLLALAGVRTLCRAAPEVQRRGSVFVRPYGSRVDCDRVVALPRLEGRSLRSLPHDAGGFIPVDGHGRVVGVADVYAAGDGTAFPVKQGGVACQQADAVAEVIAKSAGAPLEPRSFRPVLRGRLLTGAGSHFMRAQVGGRGDDPAESGPRPLWWPPSKIAGRYLAPYLHATADHPEAREYDLAHL